MSVAVTVLEYCAPRCGSLVLQRQPDGSLSVRGEPPEYLAISLAVLDAAEARYLTWQGDRLRFDVRPETLYYQPVFADLFRPDSVIVCRHVSAPEEKAEA